MKVFKSESTNTNVIKKKILIFIENQTKPPGT